MRLAVLVVTLAFTGGCARDGGEAGSGPLRIFAASSLTEIFSELDPSAGYQFAGSDDLALQLREGARADVLAAASPRYPAELHDEGVVEQPVVFATNRLVLAVPEDNPGGIRSVDDLSAPDVKLVIGAEGVPVGDYTRQVLENLDATGVLDSVVSEEEDVKAIVSKIALGEADAGFAYATDVKPVEEDVLSIELPAEAQPNVQYTIAVVSESERKAEAQDFIHLVLSDEGVEVLEAAGFGTP